MTEDIVGASVLALFMLCAAILVFWTTQVAAAPQKPLCVDPEMREQARALMLAGIDDALKRYTVRVYNTWMKDPSQQPARARAGMRQAVSAYIGAYKAAQEWDPPRCGEE